MFRSLSLHAHLHSPFSSPAAPICTTTTASYPLSLPSHLHHRYHGVVRGDAAVSRVRSSATEALASGGKGLNVMGEFFRWREEWRRHLLVRNQLRHATPRLDIPIITFGIYLVSEATYNRPSGKHHH